MNGQANKSVCLLLLFVSNAYRGESITAVGLRIAERLASVEPHAERFAVLAVDALPRPMMDEAHEEPRGHAPFSFWHKQKRLKTEWVPPS